MGSVRTTVDQHVLWAAKAQFLFAASRSAQAEVAQNKQDDDHEPNDVDDLVHETPMRSRPAPVPVA